jgi:isoaspartyl peptidase/L-asparaginase-like protein (Ntn-hydrolase superfamily)
MEKSEHVFLIGEGAERFAREHGISFEDAEYFLTEARIAQLAEAKEKQAIVLDHSQANERKLGTVGAVARDRSGNLAAATSTGGLVNQQWGRVGDSAIIGAGVFADNASCAVSCTGIGEHLLRTSLAKTAALFVEYRGLRADEAADAAIWYLVDKVHGLGGLIIVDRGGTCARANSPPGMLNGRERRATRTDDVAASICCRHADSIDGTRAHRDARLRSCCSRNPVESSSHSLSKATIRGTSEDARRLRSSIASVVKPP